MAFSCKAFPLLLIWSGMCVLLFELPSLSQGTGLRRYRRMAIAVPHVECAYAHDVSRHAATRETPFSSFAHEARLLPLGVALAAIFRSLQQVPS